MEYAESSVNDSNIAQERGSQSKWSKLDSNIMCQIYNSNDYRAEFLLLIMCDATISLKEWQKNWDAWRFSMTATHNSTVIIPIQAILTYITFRILFSLIIIAHIEVLTACLHPYKYHFFLSRLSDLHDGMMPLKPSAWPTVTEICTSMGFSRKHSDLISSW
jgi:hypothetical protein